MLKLTIISLLLITSLISAEICPNPDIKIKSYTTQDATVLTHIAYIVELTVKCQSLDDYGSDSLNLHAQFGDTLVPVGVVAPHKYQVSWTEDVKTTKGREMIVNIYDENGYAAFRKALRNGDNTSSVPVFYELKLTLPSTYKGPWISCEFLAVTFSFTFAYFAFSFRAKLVS